MHYLRMIVAQVLCWLVEPVSAVIQSLSSSTLTDLLQELQGNEGQLATVLHNKVHTPTHTKSLTNFRAKMREMILWSDWCNVLAATCCLVIRSPYCLFKQQLCSTASSVCSHVQSILHSSLNTEYNSGLTAVSLVGPLMIFYILCVDKFH